MRAMMAALLATAVTFISAQAQAPGKDGLKELKYTELGQKVRSLQGKVAVVYFWSGT